MGLASHPEPVASARRLDLATPRGGWVTCRATPMGPYSWDAVATVTGVGGVHHAPLYPRGGRRGRVAAGSGCSDPAVSEPKLAGARICDAVVVGGDDHHPAPSGHRQDEVQDAPA